MQIPAHFWSVGAVESGGVTEVSVTPVARESMSQRLWALDWTPILSWTSDEVYVEYGRLADVVPFMTALFPQTFNVGRQWFQEGMSGAKHRFGEEMDVIVFRTVEKIVGVLAGH